MPGGIVVRRKKQHPLESLQRRSGLAETALGHGKIDACGAGSGILGECSLPQRQSGSEIACLRVKNRKIASRSFVQRICTQGCLVLRLCPRALAAYLLKETELGMQFRIASLGRIGGFGLEQQLHRAFAGGTIAAQSQLRPGDSFVAHARVNGFEAIWMR
jgi:hypothetical protein